MIEVSHLTKKYGEHLAVRDLSFSVEKGEILGFLGPNGAGKSTTMNILTGYLSPTEGSVCVAGKDILDYPKEVKKNIGYLPEIPPLYTDMTVKEYLSFVFDLKNVKLAKNPHLKEICGLVKITGVYDRLIRNLSKGYRQRVGIAQALIGNPEVLILDEPTVGLDPKQIIEIRTLIKRLGQTHTIILSSHILSEIQAICKRVIVLNNGVLVADGAPDALAKEISGNHRVLVRLMGSELENLRVLRGIQNVEKAVSLGSKEDGTFDYSIEARQGTDIRKAVYDRLSERRIPMLGMKSSEMSLEDIFLTLTAEGSTTKIITNQAPLKKVKKSDLEAQENAQAETDDAAQDDGAKEETK